MGYIDKDSDLTSLEDIKDSLERYPGNHYMMRLIESFVTKYPGKLEPVHSIFLNLQDF